MSHGCAVTAELPPDVLLRLGDERIIINPGSVGQPRDGTPEASYAVFDSEENSVTRHLVEYDIPTIQDRMRSHRLPRRLIDRLARGQ